MAFHRAIAWCAVLLLAVSVTQVRASSVNPVFDSPTQSVKANVDVLAISTVIRDSSGNQDVYLATVRVKGQAPQLARLIDTYPLSSKPIRRDVLRNRAALRMTLVRSPERDSSGQDVFLDADDRNIFDPDVRAELAKQPSGTIPCFTIVHGQTKLAY